MHSLLLTFDRVSTHCYEKEGSGEGEGGGGILEYTSIKTIFMHLFLKLQKLKKRIIFGK